jgi:hypothetical protein
LLARREIPNWVGYCAIEAVWKIVADMRQSKIDLPVSAILLEPGPVVLVSSCWKGEINIMALGWYTVMEFEPSLVGCVIASGNHSFELIRKNRECVINVSTRNLLDAVVGIGNSSGRSINKVQFLHIRGGKGARCVAPAAPPDAALFGRRSVHGIGQYHQPAGAISSGAVKRLTTFLVIS